MAQHIVNGFSAFYLSLTQIMWNSLTTLISKSPIRKPRVSGTNSDIFNVTNIFDDAFNQL